MKKLTDYSYSIDEEELNKYSTILADLINGKEKFSALREEEKDLAIRALFISYMDISTYPKITEDFMKSIIEQINKHETIRLKLEDNVAILFCEIEKLEHESIESSKLENSMNFIRDFIMKANKERCETEHELRTDILELEDKISYLTAKIKQLDKDIDSMIG